MDVKYLLQWIVCLHAYIYMYILIRFLKNENVFRTGNDNTLIVPCQQFYLECYLQNVRS